MSVSNCESLLGGFIEDEFGYLAKLGVEMDDHSTHMYRLTAATLIERAAGITLWPHCSHSCRLIVPHTPRQLGSISIHCFIKNKMLAFG